MELYKLFEAGDYKGFVRAIRQSYKIKKEENKRECQVIESNKGRCCVTLL
jgi:hypothetical protein